MIILGDVNIVSKYTTVERAKFNRWWVWSNGDYLDTSDVVRLLNKQDKLIEELHETNSDAVKALLIERLEVQRLEKEKKILLKTLSELKEYQKEVEKINQQFRGMIYCYENGIL